jgi:4-amino-4-deoxy-L-arabinose transferase-like glycosyltransferase
MNDLLARPAQPSAPVAAARASQPSQARRPALATGPVLAVAASFFIVNMALAARYGYHRDELYFLACAKRLAWGYVDQPPLVPAMTRLATALFGRSVVGVRLFPALAGAGLVVIVGLLTRELGGGRRAQLLAALLTVSSGMFLGGFHLLSTAAFDVVFWAAILLLAARLVRTGDERLWLAIGAVVGVGLLNKHNALFCCFGLGVGLAATGWRRQVRSGWLWAGAALALLLWAPNLVWNAQHHWASWQMLQSLHRENSNLAASIKFIPSQVLEIGPLTAPFWIGGLLWLLRDPVGRPWRSLGIGYLVLLVVCVLIGAKPYYLAGWYPVLFAAGGIHLDTRLRSRQRPSSLALPLALMATQVLAALPLALPVLPPSALANTVHDNINKELGATVGWTRVTRQVAAAYETLRPAERRSAVILTANYGEAGAVDHFGPALGLPAAISPHNNYWIWGPRGAADGATTIAVGMPEDQLRPYFGQITRVGTVDTGYGIHTEEYGRAIYVCRQQRVSWSQLWPRIKTYG